MHEHHKKIAVLYHGGCPDGFGGAYSAWKKLGDTAEYIPVKYGNPPPEGLAGREVYIVDFCYELPEQLEKLAQTTKRLVVLDHHKSNQARVESAPEHVYDVNRSGAGIAWDFFHPNTPRPRLIEHLEDDDLYRFTLPETKAIVIYLGVNPHNFEKWDSFATQLENPTTRTELMNDLRKYEEYFEILAQHAAAQAKMVNFEGYECFFANTHPFISMRSRVGRILIEKKPPIALITSAHPKGYGVSLRSNGTVDVSELAKKHGGGGHSQSAGFGIEWGQPLPWIFLEDDLPADK